MDSAPDIKRRVLFILITPLLVLFGLAALVYFLLESAAVDPVPLLIGLLGTRVPAETLNTALNLLDFPLRIVFVIFVFVAAWLVSRISDRLAVWTLRITRFERQPAESQTVPVDESEKRAEPPTGQASETLPGGRQATVRQLLASLISVFAYTLAALLALTRFVDLANLAILVTVVSTALGFAARDYIGDLLNGISNIFENRFAIGDNIAVFRVGEAVEGVVENVTIRTLAIRTRGGELILVPQGEVRILRNYSRGAFSGTTVTCRVSADDLPDALSLLRHLAPDTPALLPDLIQPWTVVCKEGELATRSEITIHAKSLYGKGAGLRLQIMTLVAERFAAAGIKLFD